MRIAIFFFLLFTSVVAKGQCQGFQLTLTKSDPSCHDFSDGSIAFNVSGNNGNFTVTITDILGNIVPVPSWNQLFAGTYNGVAVDDSNCVSTTSIFLVNPPEIQAQFTYTDPTHLDSCNGIAEIDTVLNYLGNYASISYFWSPGGPGGVGETIKNDLCNDFYSVTINDEYGCNTVIDFASGSASTDHIDKEKSISFYPHPVVNQLNLALPNVNDAVFQIYSVSGQLIRSGVVTNGKIDFTGLEQGQYVLKITSKGNEYSSLIVKG